MGIEHILLLGPAGSDRMEEPPRFLDRSDVQTIHLCFSGGTRTRLLVLVLTGSDWVVTEPCCFLGAPWKSQNVQEGKLSRLHDLRRCFLGGARTRFLVLVFA